MKKILFLFLYLVLSQTQCFSPTLYGTNSYVEYQVGTLPIVISVPHGGFRNPTLIPDRTCNDPVTVTDAYTIETAEKISAVEVSSPKQLATSGFADIVEDLLPTVVNISASQEIGYGPRI